MEGVSRTASPLIFIILARFLTPDDFGVVAIAMLAISFSQMFWDAGLGKALIQTREAPEKAANVVFWTNLVLGILVYGLLFFAAPLIADFFHSPASLPVLRLLGFQVVILSLTSVQQALLVRDLDFCRLFWIKLATALVPGLFSIPLALSGYGVWALVAGYLAGSLLNLTLLWRQSPWRPAWHFDWPLAQKLFNFGAWIVGESLVAWFCIYGDNLIVGKFLGMRDLGVYSVGWNATTIIFGLALNPFLPVLYPTFSRLQDDPETLRATFHKANRVVMSLALPMGASLLLLGPQIATVLFGAKWQGLGLVISLIGFMQGLGWLVGLNPVLYSALGRPDVNTKLMLLAILYYVPAFLIAAPYGLQVFTLTRLGVALVALPLHVYFCVRLLGVSPLYLWHDGKPMILATLAMALVVGGAEWFLVQFAVGLSAIIQLLALMGLGIATYLGVLWIVDSPYLLQTKNLLKKAAFN